MASQHLIKLHDEANLSTLNRVFTDVWTVLRADDPFRDWDKDGELKMSVAQRLLGLVVSGVSDPDELRQKALETMRPDHGFVVGSLHQGAVPAA